MLSQTYFTQEASSFQLPLEKGQTPGLFYVINDYLWRRPGDINWFCVSMLFHNINFRA
jgi:hypothetical protein